MATNSYTFRLDSMHVNFQRGKDPDQDLVTFVVKVGDQVFGPLSGSIAKPLNSGDTILFADFPPNNPVGTTTWEIGPINISDGDIVSIGYGVINVSDNSESGTLSLGDEIKITSAWVGGWTGVVGAIIAATAPATAGATAVIGVLVAAGGAVVAFLGELLGDLFGHETHCNGTVLSDKELFSGSQLATIAGNLQFGDSHTYSIQYDNPDSPSECGHPPETVLTWSIINQTVPDLFGSDIPLGPTQPPSPVIGSHPEDWAGNWGENGFLEDSRVNVQILAIPGSDGATGAAGQTPLDTKGAVPGLRQQIGADPRGFVRLPLAPSVIGPVLALPGATLAPGQATISRLFSVAHQKVFLTERAQPETGTILAEMDGLETWDMPMIAPAYTQNFFNLPTGSEVAGPSLGLSQGTSGTALSIDPPEAVLTTVGITGASSSAHRNAVQLSGINPQLSDVAVRPVPLPFADSLALGDGVVLQMYGDFAADHTLIRRHVRYLRTQSNGHIISDVMLGFSQPLPH